MGTGLVSPLHIIVLLLIVLLVFGAKRLPELGRGLGSGMREFKDAVTGHEAEEPRPAVTAAAEQPQPVAPQPHAEQPAAAPTQPAPRD